MERESAFADDDLDVDRSVGRQRRRVSEISPTTSPTCRPPGLRDAGGSKALPFPAAIWKTVECDDHPLADRDARQIRLVDARADAQVLGVRHARDDLPRGHGFPGLAGQAVNDPVGGSADRQQRDPPLELVRGFRRELHASPLRALEGIQQRLGLRETFLCVRQARLIGIVGRPRNGRFLQQARVRFEDLATVIGFAPKPLDLRARALPLFRSLEGARARGQGRPALVRVRKLHGGALLDARRGKSAATVAESAAHPPPGGGSSVPSLVSRNAQVPARRRRRRHRRREDGETRRRRAEARGPPRRRRPPPGEGEVDSFIGYGHSVPDFRRVDLLFRRRRLPLVVVRPQWSRTSSPTKIRSVLVSFRC